MTQKLSAPPRTLSPRQAEIVFLVARGLSNAEIAKKLVVSEHTVKTHIRRAMRNLEARSRTELITNAFVARILTPEQMQEGTKLQ